MEKFPDLPMFQGINAPSRIEIDLHDLEVEGELPRELRGAFYRVAPDRQYPPICHDDVPYRHGWLLGFDFARSSLGHVDNATGKTKVWNAPPDTTVQEPCFIPKNADAAEGEGYILQVATRIKEMRTDVFLLDALRIEQGPIATIRLPLRLRPGYHGSWTPSEELPPF